MLRPILRAVTIVACVLAVAWYLGGVQRIYHTESAHAGEVFPEDVLSELTPEGIAWARKVIQHSIRLVNGKPVRQPPFVDAETAEIISLVASVVEKAAKSIDMTSAIPGEV